MDQTIKSEADNSTSTTAHTAASIPVVPSSSFSSSPTKFPFSSLTVPPLPLPAHLLAALSSPTHNNINMHAITTSATTAPVPSPTASSSSPSPPSSLPVPVAISSTALPSPPSRSCNCKNSRCLKLYCECFASGAVCDPKQCNCKACLNSGAHEAERQKAIEATKERNPKAFQPKIATSPAHSRGLAPVAASPVRQVHHSGCRCKKSFCLKKYCECFQAGISCSENCRCQDCKNAEPRHAHEAKDGSMANQYKPHTINAFARSLQSIGQYQSISEETAAAALSELSTPKEPNTINPRFGMAMSFSFSSLKRRPDIQAQALAAVERAKEASMKDPAMMEMARKKLRANNSHEETDGLQCDEDITGPVGDSSPKSANGSASESTATADAAAVVTKSEAAN